MPLSANLGKKLRETLDESAVGSQESVIELEVLKPLFELQKQHFSCTKEK